MKNEIEKLYRALNRNEIEKGNRLIPKSFAYDFKDNARFALKFPINLTNSIENAIDNHQRFGGDIETIGISTTIELDVAKGYAKKNKIIAIMSIEKIRSYGIKLYNVEDWIPSNNIIKPKDKEVILVAENNLFPEDIIIEIIEI
ncbi:MAG: hypothetical protein JEY96_19320 [Bacteroidales bacterium]|nr:hypothetical protein [Bacteroidales bacterium]